MKVMRMRIKSRVAIPYFCAGASIISVRAFARALILKAITPCAEKRSSQTHSRVLLGVSLSFSPNAC